MPLSALIGTRIRDTRARLGLRQADLAQAAGISASYLNLIEHNRRRISPELLARLAAALDILPEQLSGGESDGDLIDGLRALAAQAEVEGIERAEEFAARFPGWAGLMARQQARIGLLERTIETLSDRMTHDPHLSAALHEVLSAAASVRSTAAILSDTPDIADDWRLRFERNLAEDSSRLAQGAEALVGYLDGQAAQETGIAAPLEEVESWLSRHDWHLPELEAGGSPDAVIAAAPELASQAAQALAQDYLSIYRHDALRLPLSTLRAALAAEGPDPGRIAQRLDLSPTVVMRRLAVLPPGDEPTFGLVACDGSGTLIFRRPLPGFALPRFGAACPLWPLYQALSRPGQPIRTPVIMAGTGGRVFSTWAICQPAWPDGYDRPPVLRAYMLILPGEPGLDAQEIGTSCRICPRTPCSARREPPIIFEARS
jgi:transcriptional regulator with XRE-family HTH domain